MTASTEQERAEFESWCDKNEYDRVERLDGSGYNNEKTKRAWLAWQAARRPPAVPWMRVMDEAMVVAGLGVADVYDDYATAKEKLNRLICWEIDVSKYFDAAAPQPPDAAPVELPKPFAITWHDSIQYPCGFPWFDRDKYPDGTKLYTEQQVRQLLAAHGVK